MLMNLSTENADLPTLLHLYNQEIDILKSKLLSGESWENLKMHRKNVSRLAMALYRNCPQSADDRTEWADRKDPGKESLLR
jgi:hypothetical protein